MKKIIKIIFFLGFSIALQAKINIETLPVPGGVAVVTFVSSHNNPIVKFGNKKILIQKIKGNLWQALVGLPLLTKPGKKKLKIIEKKQRFIEFEVFPFEYKTQYITFKNDKKKYVNTGTSSNSSANNKFLNRIKKERKVLGMARKTHSDNLLANGDFIWPAQGIITGKFGLKRFYNSKPKNPHTGIDIANNKNTPILATQSGKVILVGEFYFNGKAVFLDHGKGLISVYIHLNKIAVRKNQIIKRGDILGYMGETGRATGVHLHWTVYLNTTAINPLLLVGEKTKK